MVESARTEATAAPVRGPELSYTRQMEESPQGWQHRSEYAIWTGNRRPDEAPYVLHEWCDRGVVPIPCRTGRPIVHRIARGTPYHVSGLFGFWIEHDVDAMWLEAPDRDGSHYTLMVGGSAGLPSNTASLFVCPKCAAQFGRESVCTGPRSYGAFLTAALRRVREFNADAKLRACPKCAAVHPATYGFYSADDEAAERAARQAQ
jgi:hypothetical protein